MVDTIDDSKFCFDIINEISKVLKTKPNAKQKIKIVTNELSNVLHADEDTVIAAIRNALEKAELPYDHEKIIFADYFLHDDMNAVWTGRRYLGIWEYMYPYVVAALKIDQNKIKIAKIACKKYEIEPDYTEYFEMFLLSLCKLDDYSEFNVSFEPTINIMYELINILCTFDIDYNQDELTALCNEQSELSKNSEEYFDRWVYLSNNIHRLLKQE